MDSSLPQGDMDIFSRSTSSFPVSIGTALALEALFDGRQPAFDSKKPLPPRIDVRNYQEMWINLSTLFRNLIGATPKEIAVSASIEDLVSVMDSEIEIINSLFLNEGNGLCKPVYYHTTYDSFVKKQGTLKWKLRQPNTPQQLIYHDRMEKTISELLKATDEHHVFDHEIEPGSSNYSALILTHLPYDLLSHTRFRSLSLLESHTGKLKTRNTWNTKYYPVGESDLSMLPFDRTLLLTLGDRVMVHPSVYKLRQLVVTTANSCKWTTATTHAKIMYDFERTIKEPFVLEHLRSL